VETVFVRCNFPQPGQPGQNLCPPAKQASVRIETGDDYSLDAHRCQQPVTVAIQGFQPLNVDEQQIARTRQRAPTAFQFSHPTSG